MHNLCATIFVATLLIAPLVWLPVVMRRRKFTVVQWAMFFPALVVTRIFWRATLPRELPLPPGQGAVIVCNHRSSSDPAFVQMVARRPVHWMVAREYTRHPAFRWFMDICEIIPVNRSGIDTASTRIAIRKTADGGLVGMFPEGRINMTDRFMLPGRPGAILVALKARVPVLPCYIEGSPYDRKPWSPFFMPARVTVRFGRPIDLSEYYGRESEPEVVGRLMIECLAAIAQLAGVDDFDPVLAGRRWKPTQAELDRDMAASVERRKRITGESA